MEGDFRVGETLVRPHLNLILKDCVEIHLEHKAMEVLECLAESPGEVVVKEEIIEKVWDGSFVSEHVLTNAISELRKALGDSAQRPQFIQTIPRKGYRLIAPVAAWEEPLVDQEAQHESSRKARYLLSRHRRAAWMVTAAILMPLLAVYVYHNLTDPGSAHYVEFPLTSLQGYESWPALSHDGRHIVFARDLRPESSHLYRQQVGRSETLQLTDGEGVIDTYPTWHPNESTIAFLRKAEGEEGRAIMTKSALGVGEAEELARGEIGPGLDYSPDGENLAMVTRNSPEEPWSIFLLFTKTGEKRRLTTPQPLDNWDVTNDRMPAFSPDGSAVAFLRCVGKGGAICAPFVQSLDSEEAEQVGNVRSRIHRVDWSPNGDSLISAEAQSVSNRYLVRTPLDGGKPVRLAFGEGAWNLSISGERLVFEKSRDDLNIWRLGGPLASPEVRAERFIASNRFEAAASYSPDGKKIGFVSDRSGFEEIWIANADGTNPYQLTYLGDASEPKWSPNGDRMLFHYLGRKQGALEAPWRPNIWVIDAQGGAPANLTADGPAPGRFSWSRDGHSIYFLSLVEGEAQIWRKSLRTGEYRQLTQSKGRKGTPAEWAGRLYFDWSGGIYSIPTDGGPERLELDRNVRQWCLWQGQIVYRVEDRSEADPEEWLQFFETFDLENEQTTRFATIKGKDNWLGGPSDVSPDGLWMLGGRFDTADSDLRLVENFR